MLTELQTGIIKATSTILFQDKEGAKYWLRDTGDSEHPYRSCSIDDGDGDGDKYSLFTIMLNNEIHIAVEIVRYDEYDNVIDDHILGTVRIHHGRECWNMANYVCMIESIIENSIL